MLLARLSMVTEIDKNIAFMAKYLAMIAMNHERIDFTFTMMCDFFSLNFESA